MHRYFQSQNSAAAEGAWLYVEEITHRVANEFAAAISALRLAGAQALGAEAQSVVSDATRRLNAYAAAHSLLRPPIAGGSVDVTHYLAELCGAIALARFKDRPVGLSIHTSHPIILDATRSWKVGLIVSELITNAARHAFSAESATGEIQVSVAVSRGQVVCGVYDTGVSAVTFKPGMGSALVNALAAELGGRIIRGRDDAVTSVVLTFPLESATEYDVTCVKEGSDARHAMPPSYARF